MKADIQDNTEEHKYSMINEINQAQLHKCSLTHMVS